MFVGTSASTDALAATELIPFANCENVYLSFQSLGGGGIMPNVASPAKIYPAPKTVQTKMQYAINSLFSNFFIS